MTFSYSGNPSDSLLDAIRFYSQDIDENDQLVSDEEIAFIIANWEQISSNPLFLAAVVCDNISAKFTREISFSADGVSLGLSDLQQKYSELADSLRAQYTANEVGGIPSAGGMIAGESFDSSIVPLSWSKGMHDNPAAGQQDYGGQQIYYGVPEIDGTY